MLTNKLHKIFKFNKVSRISSYTLSSYCPQLRDYCAIYCLHMPALRILEMYEYRKCCAPLCFHVQYLKYVADLVSNLFHQFENLTVAFAFYKYFYEHDVLVTLIKDAVPVQLRNMP